VSLATRDAGWWSVFEDVKAEERPWNSDKRVRYDESHSKREEGHCGCDEIVKLPSNYSRNRAMMIRPVGIVVQPYVQRRANRHCKHRKMRCEKADDKKCQGRRGPVSSMHRDRGHSRRRSALSTAISKWCIPKGAPASHAGGVDEAVLSGPLQVVAPLARDRHGTPVQHNEAQLLG
jgi:hypothetical protein